MGQTPSCRSSEGLSSAGLCASCRAKTEEDAADGVASVLFLGEECIPLNGKTRGHLQRSLRQATGLTSTTSSGSGFVSASEDSLLSPAASQLALPAESSQPVQHLAVEPQCVCLPGVEGGSPSEGGLPGPGNRLALVPAIRTKLRNFRGSMEREEAPTEDEITRGVHLQKVYDFYDVQARKCRVRKMFDDVLHKRHSSRAEPEEELSELSEISDGSDSVGRTRSTSSDYSQEGSDGGSPRRPPRRRKCFQRASTLTDLERVTKWGVLVGRLLHREFAIYDTMFDTKGVRRKLTTERGPRQMRHVVATCVRRRARCVVKRAEALAKQLLEDTKDVFDWEWEWEEQPPLLEYLFGKTYLDTLILLANTARKTVAEQPVLVEVEAPCKIFGDIHGQLRDMLFLFGAFGSPTAHGPNFVFNGDFVDRGSHQISTLGLLLALKVALPNRVWLIRGNHEDKTMNEKYGFQDECTRVLGEDFGPKAYDSFHKVFDQLPVAGLVSQRVLVLHGGIGDGSWTLRDLRVIRRPLSSNKLAEPANKWILNLLWSDPIEEDDSSMRGVFGAHASPRGTLGLRFAWDLTRTFCARNGLGLIVRSHQSKQGSLGFDIMHDNMLVRVFSARDYEEHGNDGAVLLVRPSHCGKLLSVRPQVLRSTTKVSDEALVRSLGTAAVRRADRVPTCRENVAVMRQSSRRQAIRRSTLTGKELDTLFKGWLWRLKDHGKPSRETDWFLEELSIARNGSLVTCSYVEQEQGVETVLVQPGGLQVARTAKVSSDRVWHDFTFQIVFEREDGEVGRLKLAAESRQYRDQWIGELRKLSSS